ncbi:hypothetical protein [Streptomyces sp. SLBN-31]|nr:hypothetical protein [Streptomyces sp. SLBN-31]
MQDRECLGPADRLWLHTITYLPSGAGAFVMGALVWIQVCKGPV